ncbi:hypothetical protein AB1N83_008060 [Pleurotus pulmonarius]
MGTGGLMNPLIFLTFLVFASSNGLLPPAVATDVSATLTLAPRATFYPRQTLLPGTGGGGGAGGGAGGGGAGGGAASPASPAVSTPSTPTTPTTPATPPTSTPPVVSPPTTTTTTPDTTATPPTTTPPTTTPVSTPSTTDAPPTSAPPPPSSVETVVSSTDTAGSIVEVTVTLPASSTSSSSSASTSPTSGAANGGDGGGLGTGSIIGLSVAGGVAVIGIVAFIIWKVTRKRGFSDFDDNEAIKWPELNAHKEGADTHPLPTHNTGRAGFETGGAGLSRAPSTSSAAPTTFSSAPSQYSNVYNTSTPDLYQDPYAVPPLPHLNPNQPYHDDPAHSGAFYDPYRGPVPQALHDPDGPPTATVAPGGGPWEGGEAIPMTQMAAAGRLSPGPGVAYGGDPFGRRSPGPTQAYGGAAYNGYAGQ